MCCNDIKVLFVIQTDLTQPLRLSAFVCREIRVSMAVVTYSNHSDYSPQAILCVYKGETYLYECW